MNLNKTINSFKLLKKNPKNQKKPERVQPTSQLVFYRHLSSLQSSCWAFALLRCNWSVCPILEESDCHSLQDDGTNKVKWGYTEKERKRPKFNRVLETISDAYIWYYAHFILLVSLQKIFLIKLTCFEVFLTRTLNETSFYYHTHSSHPASSERNFSQWLLLETGS